MTGIPSPTARAFLFAALVPLLVPACGPTDADDASDARSIDSSPGSPDASRPDAAEQPDAIPQPDATPQPDAILQPDADPNDETPPLVESTAPVDDATAVSPAPAITVTFNEPMNPATVTTNTANTTCSGSLQVSGDAFSSCVQMSASPTTGDNATFAMTPAAPLDSAGQYLIRVTTAVEDTAGNSLALQFETTNGFTVRYYHSIPIDDQNDFAAGTEQVAASTTGAQIFISHDETNLYLGLAHSDILVGGAGNKFTYFLLSTDPDLAVGNTASSDDMAIFGAAATKRFTYHWKERIDGASYSEFSVADGTDWDQDWTTTGKSVFRSAGMIEASIALSQFGALPETILVSTYTVDYAGDGGNGWLYNMLAGATDGSGVSPTDLVGYVQLDLPSSLPPNHASHLRTF